MDSVPSSHCSLEQLIRSPQLKATAEKLRLSEPALLGHILFLFSAIAEDEIGCVGHSPAEVCTAAKWINGADPFVKTLVDDGWLETDDLHYVIGEEWLVIADICTTEFEICDDHEHGPDCNHDGIEERDSIEDN